MGGLLVQAVQRMIGRRGVVLQKFPPCLIGQQRDWIAEQVHPQHALAPMPWARMAQVKILQPRP